MMIGKTEDIKFWLSSVIPKLTTKMWIPLFSNGVPPLPHWEEISQTMHENFYIFFSQIKKHIPMFLPDTPEGRRSVTTLWQLDKNQNLPMGSGGKKLLAGWLVPPVWRDPLFCSFVCRTGFVCFPAQPQG